MEISIQRYTKDKIDDVIAFEAELRRQEPDTYFWEVDDGYRKAVEASFEDGRFHDCAVSLLAIRDGRVIGRIDGSIIFSHFDGTAYEAYLNWICVLKSERHGRVAQALLNALKEELKARGIEQLVLLTAGNEEAVAFYDHCDDIKFDRGATIKVK